MAKAPSGADTQMPILKTEGTDPGLSPGQQELGGWQTSRAPAPDPPKLRYSWAPHLLYTDLLTGPREWGRGEGPSLESFAHLLSCFSDLLPDLVSIDLGGYWERAGCWRGGLPVQLWKSLSLLKPAHMRPVLVKTGI